MMLPTLAPPEPASPARLHLQVRGVVQGVGFRPFVHRLALAHHLNGFVRNDNAGVAIEVEGAPADLASFQDAIKSDAPPAAQINEIVVVEVAPCGAQGFAIRSSERLPDAQTLVSPDLAICDDCLRELFDPTDRRYRYPFINCTNCGPRYTIVRDLPYDRPMTTMAAFTLCATCRQEYDDPGNRRFHAQPNACPDCGPRLEYRRLNLHLYGSETNYEDGTAKALGGEDALQAAQHEIARGNITTIKGIGGYHLACDATNEQAVRRLRQAKMRGDKPFAIMARDLASVLQVAHVNGEEIALLSSSARPIVLLKRRAHSPLAAAVAPGNPLIGVMLPYTPLHHLLFAPAPGSAMHLVPWLVMTSANHAGEPIVSDDQVACTRLYDLADAVLLHSRPILLPCDDSVVRVVDGQVLPIRRARGYAPLPVPIAHTAPAILAVGGEIKSTFCLAKGDQAFLSQHLGDMATLETQASFDATATHLQDLLRIQPVVVACDSHPAYLSTKWAHRWVAAHPGTQLVQVQHHHAHIAALMAEHRFPADQQIIGICFDGTGYGPDGAIWGGEVLLADYTRFSRAAHLAYLPLPGGDAAVHKPYRMALAALWAADIPWESSLPPVVAASPGERMILQRQLETGLNCVPTSSMGRLFDVVASLCDVCHEASYEAQAAIELEAYTVPNMDSYCFAFNSEGENIFDAAPVLRAIVRDWCLGLSPAKIATRFHNAVADLIVTISQRLRQRSGINQVALTGGVFQNQLLLHESMHRLRAANFEVLVHQKVPPNDGGLALGQAIVAAHQERALCV